MDHSLPATVLHWNYRGFTEFPLSKLDGEETEITDIYLKENLISDLPADIYKLVHLESLYLSGNDIRELPREISKLRCLKCLDVSGNRLKRIPDEVADIKGLKFLIFDENELRHLPLRLAELRRLQYLSVCDNNLQWLPQRPVYNYHHCEIRFWRNRTLSTIPYSLWYHMFRGQQTRCINIGCLTIPKYQDSFTNGRCKLKLYQSSTEYELNIDVPIENIIHRNKNTLPSLFELCKRVLYDASSETAREITRKTSRYHSVYYENSYGYLNNNIVSLEDNFEGINIGNSNYDVNGNNLDSHEMNNDILNRRTNYKNKEINAQYVVKDVIEKYFNELPVFIKKELSNGPISRCENSDCRKPLFDYVIYEFCIGKIFLIDNTEDIILSATFCSKACADIWRYGKDVVSWSIENNIQT